MSNSPAEASLAALCQRSLKRTRILYNVTPESTFLPSVDKSILTSSINRRKRRLQPRQQQAQGNSSNALALVTDGATTTASTSTGNPSSALVLGGAAAEEANSQKQGGILVVRFTRVAACSNCMTLSHRVLLHVLYYFRFRNRAKTLTRSKFPLLLGTPPGNFPLFYRHI
jgi:hypothetical protein